MRAWLLALGSGALQVLIFPTPSCYFLSWVALAPLMTAILLGRGRRGEQVLDEHSRDLRAFSAGQAFWLGYSSGIVWYAGCCYWIYHVMHIYGGLAPPVAAALLVAFALYLGLYHGLFACLLALAARSPHHKARGLLLAPFFWVAVELARARITGFPWNLLGTSQVDNLPLAQIAAFTGVYGVSFEIALVNAGFAAGWLLPPGRRARVLVAALAASAALQAGVWLHPAPLPATHAARLVQPDIPILEPSAWTADYFEATLASVVELSAAGRDRRFPDLIIWPESPAPFYTTDPRLHDWVRRLASATRAYVIVGSLGIRSSRDGGMRTQMMNSAALVAPNGEWVARYDKIHLVPFGEYVPFKSLLVFAEKLTREVGDFSAGSERTVFSLGEQKVAAFICYESIFPDEVRQFAGRGAQVFVNISNDGWFGNSGAPEQHLNMARMRAVENHRWLLRATNTGITASIDPYGRVVARAGRNVRAALDAPYEPVMETTFYTRHGDWFAWSCAIISLLALLARFQVRVGRAG